MKKDVIKYIEEYKQLEANSQEENANIILFDISDYTQIYDISTDIFSLIDNSAMFGFMTGYKAAMKEKR